MTPAARLQAAAEVLDLVIASAIEDGPPADLIVSRYFKTRRYAGSKDRRAVRELVFRAIRRSGERPASGRAAIAGLASDDPGMTALFGEARGPEPLTPKERRAERGILPEWVAPLLSPLVAEDEWPQLLERAPLDLRINAARTSRQEMLPEFEGAEPTSISPWGLRLPTDSKVEDSGPYQLGLVEIQDEGSQLIALACELERARQIVDLCAGAGGKALALAAAAPNADILATDTNRARLSRLEPRAGRALARIEARLLDSPRELEQLNDWKARADVVLIDAPCSGSGTWRRNPEGRWRLTPARLDRLVAIQARLLNIGSELVRPGGALVYAVCSIFSREGAGQASAFLERHSSWVEEETAIPAGRLDGPGRLLSPGHDGTDGFFVARMRRPC